MSMGVRRIFSRGCKVDLLLIFFRLLMLTIRSATRRGEPGSCPPEIVLLGTTTSYNHFAPAPPKIAQQENVSWLRSYDDAMQMDVNKMLYAFY